VRNERKKEFELIHKFTFYLNGQDINNSFLIDNSDQEYLQMTGRLKIWITLLQKKKTEINCVNIVL